MGTEPTVQDTLDVVADLQLKVGVGGVLRDRILVTLLPPPADPTKRDQIKRLLDDAVPELLLCHGSAGALSPAAYELTQRGWLRSKFQARVLQIIGAYLNAFREHVTSGNTTQRVSWPDLVACGLKDADYPLACTVARSFELQNGGSSQGWDGKHPPTAWFGLPIDADELLDVVDANELVTRRQTVSYLRLHSRKVIEREISGHVRRAVDRIYQHFCKTGTWPLSRTLHVQLASENISLEQIASGRFARGHNIHTEGARTMMTLAGLLLPADAQDDRRSVVAVLRFVGEYSRIHPEDRTIDALTVMDRLGIDDVQVITVAKLLQCQGSVYVNSGSDTYDVEKMLFYLSPAFIAHARANELWDVVLDEEEDVCHRQVRQLQSLPVRLDSAADDAEDDELPPSPPREVTLAQGSSGLRAGNPDAAWIFYSWQSDLPNKTNRGFIEEALDRATKAIRSDDSVLIDPVIDRDTQGVAGSPDIGATIFAKIETSAAFVCDVSCINSDKGGRATPNPNVLIELGYAAKALGWDRIILVANEAFGPVENLPFDLRLKRTVTYALGTDDAKGPERTRLAKILEHGLRAILTKPVEPVEPVEPEPTSLERAIEGVAEARSDAGARIGDYMRWLVTEIDAGKPAPQSGQPVEPEDELLVQAINATVPFVEGFARLADTIARHGTKEPARALMSAFEVVLASYDKAPSPTASSWRTTDFDFHKFLGHELFVVYVSALLRTGHLELLDVIFRVDLYVATIRGRGNKSWIDLSDHCSLFDDRKRRLQVPRTSLRADVLQERHNTGELGRLSPFEAFVEAEYFLFLASDLGSESSGTRTWHPVTLVFIEYTAPSFLVRAQKRAYAERLLAPFRLPDIETFRARYRERGLRAANMFGVNAIHGLRQMDPDTIAST